MKVTNLNEILNKNITYRQYKQAVHRGQITVVKKGYGKSPTLVDAGSPYFMRQDKPNPSTASL